MSHSLFTLTVGLRVHSFLIYSTNIECLLYASHCTKVGGTTKDRITRPEPKTILDRVGSQKLSTQQEVNQFQQGVDLPGQSLVQGPRTSTMSITHCIKVVLYWGYRPIINYNTV